MKTETAGGEVQEIKAISVSTPVQIGLVISLIAVLAAAGGGFFKWSWWAASMSAKLDAVLATQTGQGSIINRISDDVSMLKDWKIQINTVGSPALNKRIDELEKDFREMHEDFKLHKATTTGDRTK